MLSRKAKFTKFLLMNVLKKLQQQQQLQNSQYQNPRSRLILYVSSRLSLTLKGLKAHKHFFLKMNALRSAWF